VEIEQDGQAYLRFGDNQFGAPPKTNATFFARYRTGNGAGGNVGAESLAHILIDPKQAGWTPGLGATAIKAVRNPLAAGGGVDPETMEHIRQVAPFAFQTQLRAVTEEDYGVMAARDPAIRNARGTLRWTGSWYTAFVSIEPQAESLSATLVDNTLGRLDLLRMIGTDLDVEGAVIVGLRIELDVCVGDDHFRGDVQHAIEQLLIIGNLCNGQPGLLNRANFTFGQTIYASPLVAAVQNVPGVEAVTLAVLARMDDPWIDGAAQGYLIMGRLEIARCDNDPNRLDHGILVLHMHGGK
jgi:predicted phage baseplate assembly protein